MGGWGYTKLLVTVVIKLLAFVLNVKIRYLWGNFHLWMKHGGLAPAGSKIFNSEKRLCLFVGEPHERLTTFYG